jgi:hypothetical protein
MPGEGKTGFKTYNSRYSLVVTHPATNLPDLRLAYGRADGVPDSLAAPPAPPPATAQPRPSRNSLDSQDVPENEPVQTEQEGRAIKKY